MLMMPTQLIDIKAKNWKEPIGWYTFNIDSQAKQIDAEDVWHERFPSLQYENGKHFMGLSPIKAAIQILNRQNSGYERAAKMYKQGIPPFLVSDPSLTGNPSPEQKKQFEKVWREKYGENRNINVPALTGEGVQVHQLGYNSVRDLAILDATQDGRRALCNIFQVAAELFNDSVGSTFNNRSEARKEMWTDRIMVDHRAYYDGINNNILPGYVEGRAMRYVPDYSDVEELQEDKRAKSGWVSQMYQDGVITGNKYRELMGEEPDEKDEHLETYYVNMNKIPANQALSSDILDDDENIQEEGKAYERMGINY
jgi:HK97 family phage portal protein